MVDRIANGKAREERDRALLTGGVDDIHRGAAGEAIEDGCVICFDEGDDVGVLGEDDFAERIGATFAAMEDVVGEDAHGAGMVKVGAESLKDRDRRQRADVKDQKKMR